MNCGLRPNGATELADAEREQRQRDTGQWHRIEVTSSGRRPVASQVVDDGNLIGSYTNVAFPPTWRFRKCRLRRHGEASEARRAKDTSTIMCASTVRALVRRRSVPV